MNDAEDFILPPLPRFTPKRTDSPTLDNPAPAPEVKAEDPKIFKLASSGLPMDETAERNILGLVMLEGDYLKVAEKFLDEYDWALDSHRVIWKHVVALRDAGRAWDFTTLRQELERSKQLSTIGGPAYLAYLTEGMPRGSGMGDYATEWARIIADKSLLRELITAAYDVQERAQMHEDRAPDLIDSLSERLSKLASRSRAVWGARSKRQVLVGAMEFARDAQPDVDWAVDGLIQRGGNGLIVGDPGTAKSYSSLDLAYHLVAGHPWLGCNIPERMKVAFVAREDNPGLTQHRALALLRGYQGGDMDAKLSEVELDEWLYFNTRAQTDTFSLQNEGDVSEIIEAFKEKGIQMAFFDVFRRLWEGDENDNQEVAKVLAKLTRIQSECGCALALVHHLGKGNGSIFQRIRGASSIYGWREWAFGISIENPEDDPKDRIRKIVFETKAATPASPIYYCFDGESDKVSIATCAPPVREYRKSSKKESGPVQEVIPWYQE